jgi:hypothetical protein
VLSTSVKGYWLRIIAPTNLLVQELTLGPFPPGTNIYANISLNELNTYFMPTETAPKFVAVGYISSWSTYLEDGTESEYEAMGFNQNAVEVYNCARISFVLEGVYVVASALVNVFTL